MTATLKKTPGLKKLIAETYPDYKGRKFFISTNVPNDLSSYWDSGSRDYYCFADLVTGQIKEVGSNHPAFEPNKPRTLNGLPSGMLLVKRSIFMGQESGITVYCNESDIPKSLILDQQKLISAI